MSRLKILNIIFVIFILSLFLLLQYYSENNIFGIRDWYIPDGIVRYHTLQEMFLRNLHISELKSSWGLYIIYYLPTLIFGFVGIIIINTYILYFSSKSDYKYQGMILVLLFFPYYLLSILLPSKDIIVLLFTTLLFFSLKKYHYLLAILLAVSVYFIRDGAFFVFISIIMGYWLVQRNFFSSLVMCLMAFIVGIFLFSYVERFIGDTFLYSRNFHIYTELSEAKLGNFSGWLDYPIRIFGNLTNHAFRPYFLNENGFSLMLFSFYISGLSILVLAVLGFRQLVYYNNHYSLSSLMFFISLAVISLNPLVQGRYLFPTATILLLDLMQYPNIRKKFILYYIMAFIVSLIAMGAYIYSGIGLPVSNISVYEFSF